MLSHLAHSSLIKLLKCNARLGGYSDVITCTYNVFQRYNNKRDAFILKHKPSNYNKHSKSNTSLR